MYRDGAHMEILKKTIRKAAREIGVLLDDRQLQRFVRYHRELLFWNERISLVSVKSEQDIPIKHFIDSLTLVPLLPPGKIRLLDIGSGAGFPGIPLRIAVDDLDVTLVESSRKKASFLKTVARELSFDHVTVLNSRMEEIVGNEGYKQGFDIVTSRALFKLPDLIPAAASFLLPGGVLMAMKGRSADDEIKRAEQRAAQERLTLQAVHRLMLPVTGDMRTIALYVKSH